MGLAGDRAFGWPQLPSPNQALLAWVLWQQALDHEALPHAHLAVTLNPSSPSCVVLPNSRKQQKMRNWCVLTKGFLVRIVEEESDALSQEKLPLILLPFKVWTKMLR